MVYRYVVGRHPIYQLRDEVDRLLSGVFHTSPLSALTRREGPAVNLWEEDDSLALEMELPGVTNEQLDLTVVDNELSIHVELPEQTEDGMTYHRRERPTGSFTRRIPLPVEVDPDNVSAELTRGVLHVILPKAPSVKPRKITVNVNE